MSDERVRIELRIEPTVANKIKWLADQSQLTVNQLIHGILEWTSSKGIPGEPRRDENGVVQSTYQPGCVFFGEPGHYLTSSEIEEDNELLRHAFDPGVDLRKPGDFRKGSIYFQLDFTERRVLRDKSSGVVEEETTKGPVTPATTKKPARKKPSKKA